MTNPDWSQLPGDLVAKLSTHLNSRLELLQFRAVCHSWRTSAIPLPTPPPLRPLLRTRSPLTKVTENVIYALQPQTRSSSSSSKCWLIKVQESGSNKFCLMNPLSGRLLKILPNKFPKVLNTLDFRVSTISKEYKLGHVQLESDSTLELGDILKWKINFVMINKAVCSSTTNVEDRTYMMIHFMGKLSFIRPGDESWTTLTVPNCRFRNLIYFKGQFYAIDSQGRTWIVDPSTSKLTAIANTIGHSDLKKFFVESNGELFVVDRHWYDSPDYSKCKAYIYKFSEKEQEWVEVQRLDDRVFLVGVSCSFSISASDFHIQGNCIIFTDVKLDADQDDIQWSECVKVFNLEDGSYDKIENYPDYLQLFVHPDAGLIN